MEYDCFWSKSSALGNTKTTKADMTAQRMETEGPASLLGYRVIILKSIHALA